MGTSVVRTLISQAGVAQPNNNVHLMPSCHSGETEAQEGKGSAKGGGSPHVRNPLLHDLSSCCTKDHTEVW